MVAIARHFIIADLASRLSGLPGPSSVLIFKLHLSSAFTLRFISVKIRQRYPGHADHEYVDTKVEYTTSLWVSCSTV